MRPPFRRRHFLVDELQYRLLAVNVLYMVVFLLFFVGVLFGPPALSLLSGTLSAETQEDAARLFLAFDERVWFPLMLLLCAWTVHSVRVSHRIAGPLVQFRRRFGELCDGHLAARLTLRQGDYLGKEATAFNEMAASIEAMMTAAHAQIAQLETDVKALRLAIDEGDATQIHPRGDRLGEHAMHLRTALQPATTRDDPTPGAR